MFTEKEEKMQSLISLFLNHSLKKYITLINSDLINIEFFSVSIAKIPRFSSGVVSPSTELAELTLLLSTGPRFMSIISLDPDINCGKQEKKYYMIIKSIDNSDHEILLSNITAYCLKKNTISKDLLL